MSVAGDVSLPNMAHFREKSRMRAFHAVMGQGFVVVRVAAVDVLKDVEAVVDGVVRLILASR